MDVRKLFYIFCISLFCYLVIFFVTKKESIVLEYDIKESDMQFHVSQKDDYLQIKVEDKVFTYKEKGQIQKIEYEKQKDYLCIHPILKDKSLDIYCMKEDITYLYQTLVNKKEINDTKKFDILKIEDDKKETFKKENITIYKNNLEKNHIVVVENYKGLTFITKEEPYQKVELFKTDVYKKEFATFAYSKYIIADYTSNHTFHEFYIVDLKNKKQSKIISDAAIDLDSYIMGNVEGRVYFYERDTKKQYSINLKNNMISTVGNISTGIQVYKNNAWDKVSAYDAYNKIYTFDENKWEVDALPYEKVEKIEDKYYIYQKNGDYYQVYQSYDGYLEHKLYLFDTSSLDVALIGDVMYFKRDDNIYLYKNGNVITILNDKEFLYNDSLKFNVITK